MIICPKQIKSAKCLPARRPADPSRSDLPFWPESSLVRKVPPVESSVWTRSLDRQPGSLARSTVLRSLPNDQLYAIASSRTVLIGSRDIYGTQTCYNPFENLQDRRQYSLDNRWSRGWSRCRHRMTAAFLKNWWFNGAITTWRRPLVWIVVFNFLDFLTDSSSLSAVLYDETSRT